MAAVFPVTKLCLMWSPLKTMGTKTKKKHLDFCVEEVGEDGRANSGSHSASLTNFILLGNEIAAEIVACKKKCMNSTTPPLSVQLTVPRILGTVCYQKENH